MQPERQGQGRRLTDTMAHLQQLTVVLAQVEKRYDLLLCENGDLKRQNAELKSQIQRQSAELATLRMLKADVLTAAIEAGFDGKIQLQKDDEK